MNPIVLLDPLSLLRHSLAYGFRDLPDALTYQSAEGCVRFDKTSGCLTLDPPETDVLGFWLSCRPWPTCRSGKSVPLC